jgi:hypothetical protein
MILLKDCLAVATLDRKALLKGRDILIQGTLPGYPHSGNPNPAYREKYKY